MRLRAENTFATFLSVKSFPVPVGMSSRRLVSPALPTVPLYHGFFDLQRLQDDTSGGIHMSSEVQYPRTWPGDRQFSPWRQTNTTTTTCNHRPAILLLLRLGLLLTLRPKAFCPSRGSRRYESRLPRLGMASLPGSTFLDQSGTGKISTICRLQSIF